RACGDGAHPERWCLEHIRLPGHRLSRCDNNFRRLYEESARWLEARGLVADSQTNVETHRARLQLGRGAQDLAMVRSLAAAVSKYVCGHFDYLTGGSNLSGVV